MKIVIGADHGGFALKEELKEYLKKKSIEITDVGNLRYDKDDDYPDFAIDVARAVSTGECEKGIVICGSGVGACIAANKIKNVRACVCHDVYSAHQGVEHDAMNVLCLGGRIIEAEAAKGLVDSFISAVYTGEERHNRRLAKVKQLEK
jgi:ribose 5-phosphate isomerase B